jgi:hypothetical protein
MLEAWQFLWRRVFKCETRDTAPRPVAVLHAGHSFRGRQSVWSEPWHTCTSLAYYLPETSPRECNTLIRNINPSRWMGPAAWRLWIPLLTYLFTYGAEPSLRIRQLCSHSRTSQHFIDRTRRFITVFTRALHWSLSWARSIQCIPSHPV